VRAVARLRDERRLKFTIQVEGGVTFDRVESFIRAGADILVAGGNESNIANDTVNKVKKAMGLYTPE